MSASAGSMPRRRAANVTPRYMAPVSRYSSPRRAASARATVDLPDPAGTSTALTCMAQTPSRGRVVHTRHWRVRRCLGPRLGAHVPRAGADLRLPAPHHAADVVSHSVDAHAQPSYTVT